MSLTYLLAGKNLGFLCNHDLLQQESYSNVLGRFAEVAASSVNL